MSFRLSVLDQSPISEGSTGAQALAQQRRPRAAGRRARLPPLLGRRTSRHADARVREPRSADRPDRARATSRIRVGSGGVMLPHYSPLKVAETFSMLSGLFPDRIDLGVGRAPGTDATTTFALQRDRRQAAPDDFPQQLAELLAYLDATLPPDHPFAHLAALPGGPERPDLWLLGSSPQSGIWAAELGLPYAFADFINPAGVDFAARYRAEFKPSAVRGSRRS